MSPKKVSRHAAFRLATRCSEATAEELQRAIEEQRFEYVRRQSTRRSLCKALIAGEVVWFIIDRPRQEAITVLTDEQAAQLL